MKCRAVMVGIAGLAAGALTAGVAALGATPRPDATTSPLVLAPTPVKIGVVHTWDELGEQPDFLIGRDQLHLGIESATGPANRAILIYCRMDTVEERQVSIKDEGEAIGPLTFKIVSKKRGIARLKQEQVIPLHESDGPELFVGAAHLDGVGPYVIQVESEGTVIATADVAAVERAADDESNGWMALRPAAGMPNTFRLSAGEVIPHWNGVGGRRPDAGEVGPAAPLQTLPTFIPQGKPTLVAGSHGQEVTIATWPGEGVNVPEQLLVRLYVGGKRMDVPAALTFSISADTTGRVIEANGPVTFNLRVTSAEVKDASDGPAGRVEAEFLYCPDGYDNPSVRMAQADRTTGAGLPRMSNRVKIDVVPDVAGPTTTP